MKTCANRIRDRVVDCDALERRCTCKRTVGSNPTVSAITGDAVTHPRELTVKLSLQPLVFAL